uniref:Alanine--glyoxylate aminotransferase n=1 Tax=Plectus sambesii TaxID=2011161 RepID=A0A914WMK9_9BILA
MDVPPPACLKSPPNIPHKLLLGPGPSNAAEDVLQAMTSPLLGHLHPEFLKIMDEVKEGIQYVFQTKNKLTFAISGTGHAGMECALVNLLEPGDRLLVVDIGFWANRATDMAERCGATVQRVTEPPGKAVDAATLEKAIESYRPHVVFVVQGESSTGVCQPLEKFGSICHKHGALLVVDTVASLGGAEFYADRLEVDCVYSATQKCLNAPPSLAPISFSERALEKIKKRTKKVQSYYLDAELLGNYWGCFDEPRRYHHTGMISSVYALRAALARLAAEGLDEAVQKHKRNVQLLYIGLDDIGVSPFVQDEKLRLPCLTTVAVPEGIDAKQVCDTLMSQGIEVAGGLGPTVGKLWRIGTFGMNSNEANIKRVVAAMKAALADQKHHI